MASVEASGLDRILESWDKLLRDFPEMKRKLLEDLGKQMLTDVQGEIPGTGTVRGWQERYIGSKNGYVAVRPKADTYKVTAGGKKYAVGYVTNAINSGHRHRRPSQTKRPGYTYKARVKVPAVAGLHFYDTVRSRLEGMGQQEMQAIVAEIVRRLEGTT